MTRSRNGWNHIEEDGRRAGKEKGLLVCGRRVEGAL